jgi:hypothetical protein
VDCRAATESSYKRSKAFAADVACSRTQHAVVNVFVELTNRSRNSVQLKVVPSVLILELEACIVDLDQKVGERIV